MESSLFFNFIYTFQRNPVQSTPTQSSFPPLSISPFIQSSNNKNKNTSHNILDSQKSSCPFTTLLHHCHTRVLSYVTLDPTTLSYLVKLVRWLGHDSITWKRGSIIYSLCATRRICRKRKKKREGRGKNERGTHDKTKKSWRGRGNVVGKSIFRAAKTP